MWQRARKKWSRTDEASKVLNNQQNFINSDIKKTIGLRIKIYSIMSYRVTEKSDYERVKWRKFLSINELSIALLEDCKKIPFA